MHRFKRIAVTVAVAGMAGLGIAGGMAGTAFAATSTDGPVTGCVLGSGMLGVGVTPDCTAAAGEVNTPLSITVDLTTSGIFTNPLISVNVTAKLDCVVDGGHVTYNYSNHAHADFTDTINLQNAVGSPVPNSCTVNDLEATGNLPLAVAGTSFSVSATAVTAVQGAVVQSAGKTSAGAQAETCADVTANGNANSRVQSWACLSDLAQYYVYTHDGQLVHNGDCVTAGNGHEVVLRPCALNFLGHPVRTQRWTKYGATNNPSKVYNSYDNECLTAPSPKNGTTLLVQGCTGAANQMWTVPGRSPAV